MSDTSLTVADGARLSTPGQSAGLFASFEKLVSLGPDHPALLDGSAVFTRAEVAAMVRRLAAFMSGSGLPPGPIGVLLPDGAAQVIACLAALAIGRMHLPIDRTSPQANQGAVAAAARLVGVVALAADRMHAETLGLPVLIYEDGLIYGDEPVSAGAEAEWPAIDATAPAVILSTSGSTGIPKGIVYDQLSMERRAEYKRVLHNIGPADVFLNIAPGHTGAGYHLRLDVLLNGATLLLSDLKTLGPSGVLGCMARARATMLRATPTVLKALLATEGAGSALASLRLVHCGGDALLRDDLFKLVAMLPPICQIYVTLNSTEGSIADWIVDPAAEDDPIRVAVGLPTNGNIVDLLDEDGQPVPDGAPGAIVARGSNFAIGEWIDGQLVTERFPVDPRNPARRVLRTGDRARRLSSGRLLMLGREDRMVKINGQRIEPSFVEGAMRRIPGVADASVQVRHDGANVSLVGYVVPANDAASDAIKDLPLAVREGLQATLPAAMIPHRVIELRALPVAASGKIDSKALLHLAETTPIINYVRSSLAGLQTQSAPSAEARRAVAIAWHRVLGAAPATGTSFLDASGDSLQLLTLVFALESQVGQRLPLDAFHAEMDPAQMARALDAARQGVTPVAGSVFLLPGARGDTPGLAGLRTDCLSVAAMDMLTYPGWEAMVRERLAVEDIVSAVIAQIEVKCPVGPVTLVGYSLGVHIAYGVARSLEQQGREVKRLVLLDMPVPRGRTGDSHVWALPKSLQDVWWDINRVRTAAIPAERLGMIIARLLGSPSLRFLLRAYAGRPWSRPGRRSRNEVAYWAWHHLSQELRFQATGAWARRWQPPAARLQAAVWLVRSEAHANDSRADLGWGELAGDVTVTQVRGDHVSMLSAANRGAVAQAVRVALGGRVA